MTIRSSIVLTSIALVGASACAAGRAHLIPGSDMAVPRGGLSQLAAAVLTGQCLQTAPIGAGRTDVQLRDCPSVQTDSAHGPSTPVLPKLARP